MREYDLSNANWRKSSYSGGDGGEECIEVTYDFVGVRWRKSSYSNGEGGNCVEVADGVPGIVPVRDSKNPQGPTLFIRPEVWSAFVAGQRAG